MERKKNKKYDLERRRPMFFGIGMMISLSVTLVAFEWKSEIEPMVALEKIEEPPVLTILIPPTNIDPPPPPKAIELVAVPDDKEIVEDLPPIDAEVREDEEVEVVISLGLMDDEPVEEAPVNWASEMPSYEGGMENFYVFLSRKVKYPRRAQQIGVEGRVFVQFVVEKDGSLSDIQVVKGIGAGCDEEALRVMNLVPRFIPGKQGDVRVRVKMIVPINFQLH